MNNLSDSLLIEAYHRAKELQFAHDFIRLFEMEIENRGL